MKTSSRLITLGALCLFVFALNTPADAQNTPSPAVPATPATPVTPTTPATPPVPVKPVEPRPIGPVKPVPVRPIDPANPTTQALDPVDTTRPVTDEVAPVVSAPVDSGAVPECLDFSCGDSNRDSKLSREELQALGDPTLRLELIDNDRNGTIDEEEWERYTQDNPR